MERKLIEYLPLFVQDYAEIKAIMDVEQVSVEKAWTSAEDVFDDQFVVDATENGIKRWESMLGIVPKATYTLDERRFKVLARLNEQLPYTYEVLKNMLAALCGEDGYAVKLDPNNYALLVKLALSNANNVEAVDELLSKVVPANIVRNVTLFNTHGMLAGITHGYLANYTHQEVREEVL